MLNDAKVRVVAAVGFLASLAIILTYLQSLKVQFKVDGDNSPKVIFREIDDKKKVELVFWNNGRDPAMNLNYKYTALGGSWSGSKSIVEAGGRLIDNGTRPPSGFTNIGFDPKDVGNLIGQRAEVCLVFDGAVPMVRQWIMLSGQFKQQSWYTVAIADLQTDKIGSSFWFLGPPC